MGYGDLQALARVQDLLALGLRDRLRISWSRLPSGDLPSAYAAMDVFAFPSTSGCQGVRPGRCRGASGERPRRHFGPAGHVRTVVADGEAGALVPPYDASKLAGALRRLVEDRPLRVKCGLAARRQATARYSLEAHLEGLRRHIVPSWDDRGCAGPGHGVSFAAFPAMTIAVLTNAYPPTVLGGAGRIAQIYADLLEHAA